MLLAGFQRREKKFGSFPELVATINKVSVASCLSKMYRSSASTFRPRSQTSVYELKFRRPFSGG